MSFYGSIYANTAAIYDNAEAIKVNKDSIASNAKAIEDEVDARSRADNEINEAIQAEIDARVEADNEINQAIANNTEAISDLTIAYQAKDEEIENKITQEINNRKSAIEDEQTSRENEDNSIKETILNLTTSLEAEKTNRENSDNDLSSRIDTIELFFNEEELNQGIDTLKEIQKYIADDGVAAEKMVADIKKNTDAINKEAEDRGNAIDEVKGIIGTVPEGKTVVNLIEDAESAVEEKVNALATGQVKANTDAIDNINKTIGITSGSESSLIDLINTNTNNITDINDTIGKYDDPLSISDRLNSLDIITTESSAKIDLLTTQTSDLSTRVDNLENSNNDGEVDSELATQVQTNTQNIENIQTLIGSETDILENDTIRGSINDHTSRISTLESDIENINTDIANIGDRIDNLEDNNTNNGSSTSSTLIAFYLSDVLYEASGSMTWQDWIYSSYNTSNYYTRHTNGQWPLRTFILKDSNNNYYSIKDTDIDEIVGGVDIIVSSLQYDLILGYVFNIVDPEGYFSTKTYFIPATMTWRNWVSSPYSRNEYEVNAAGSNIQTKAIRDGETYGATVNGINGIDNLPDYSITEYTLGTEWVP